MSGSRTPLILLCALLLALNVWASEQHAPAVSTPTVAPEANAVVHQPRAFGYFLGDVLTQRVLLELEGEAFELAELPRVERVGVWFERRPSRIVTSNDDGRRWLALQYQIINAPRELRRVELPALKISDDAGTRELVVPAMSISLSPLTPAVALEEALQSLQPDRDAPHMPTHELWRKTAMLVAACAMVLALWIGWIAWRNWLARKDQPFARALDDLRQLDERAPEAWQAMHRAFDRTAGRVVQGPTLAPLFVRAPHFAAQSEQIGRFYAQSSELFFGRGLPDDALSVHRLCRELRRLERQHE
jgi:mxaA protein